MIGYGEKLNRNKIQPIPLQPSVLNNLEKRSSSVKLFGKEVGLPYGITPMGMCNLSTPGADLMLARMAARHQVPVCVSTTASTSLEKVISVAEGNALLAVDLGTP
jgi:(S)-mandelate dehydrogenase